MFRAGASQGAGVPASYRGCGEGMSRACGFLAFAKVVFVLGLPMREGRVLRRGRRRCEGTAGVAIEVRAACAARHQGTDRAGHRRFPPIAHDVTGWLDQPGCKDDVSGKKAVKQKSGAVDAARRYGR